jgi:signal transduction histidine kinase
MSLIDETISLFKSSIKAKKLDLTITESADLPSIIFQDHAKLGQVLVNIFSNAVKYTNIGHIKVMVSKLLKDSQEFIQVIVEDSGIGIKNAEKLGQWFCDLEVIENVNQNGVGFGLNISNRIIQKLGGSIEIHNNQDLHKD